MTYRDKLGLKGNGPVRGYSPRYERKRVTRKEGHDQLIVDLAEKGADISIRLMSGGDMYGRLVQSDRFTITIDDSEGKEPPVLIYKHAIEFFTITVRE